MSRARDLANTTTALLVDGTVKLDGNYPVGTSNVALGDAALDSPSLTGNGNTALGAYVLTSNTSAGNNTGVGNGALSAATTGGFNTAVGANGLVSNTSGAYNTAIGDSALRYNTTANYNTAVGYRAGYLATGTLNTYFGSQTGENTTTGTENLGAGASALYTNTTGSYNTAIGRAALFSNTTASNLTAVGYQAGYSNTTGTNSVYIGHQSGDAVTTANSNTFVGRASGGQTTTGGANTFIGEGSGGGNVTGASNTFLGHDSGSTVTGSNNTILGKFNGNQNGLDIRTSSSNIVLSDGNGQPRIHVDSSGYTTISPAQGSVNLTGTRHIIHNTASGWYACAFEQGSGANPLGIQVYYSDLAPNNTGNPFIICEDYALTRFFVYSNGNVVNRNNSYGAISDEKLKENIVDSGSQWDDIKALRVRKYSMKEQASAVPTQLGVIAQELEAAGMGGLVFESPDRDRDNNDLGTVTKQVNYSVLYMKAVKALQEAMERIETLETENVAIKARLDALEAV